ncbi:hypothetical protein GOBAR_DD28682 [Gossypium barbadense]|nr:hypothetical protein GOBAR_DD28682 [Gossypium barbadense]
MGCCLSSKKGSSRGKEAQHAGLESFNQKPSLESRAPPPSAEEETIEKPAFVKIQGEESLNFNIKPEPKLPVNVIEESASEDVSEICSVSVVGRSPTRKIDQSPGRRNGVVNGGSASVRLVHSREPTVRRGSRPAPTRKDPGESSGRRSRSPAVNRSVMGRSPSGRRTNQSPGRARLDPGETGNSKKVEQQHGATTTTTMEGKWPSSNNNAATS